MIPGNLLARWAEETAQALFEKGCSVLVSALESKTIGVADIPHQLMIFTAAMGGIRAAERSLPVWIPVDERAAWGALARDHMRREVTELFQSTIQSWSRNAPGRDASRFTRAIDENVPLAVYLFLFPKAYPGAAWQRADLAAVFEMLAEIAGLIRYSAVRELKRCLRADPLRQRI